MVFGDVGDLGTDTFIGSAWERARFGRWRPFNHRSFKTNSILVTEAGLSGVSRGCTSNIFLKEVEYNIGLLLFCKGKKCNMITINKGWPLYLIFMLKEF